MSDPAALCPRPRILILMATRTYRAEAFLRAASRLGLDVTVGSEQDHILARLTPAASLALDLGHPARAQRQILDFAREHPLEAVVGVDDDTTLVAALAAEALGRPHNSAESVKAARYKDVMRLILSETDLNVPDFQLIGTDEDPNLVGPRLSYPCVVKPLSLSASRGVIRADDPGQFRAAFREVVDILSETGLKPDDPSARQVLVETFVPGPEFALEGLLRGGELTVLALFDKPDPLDGPYFEETIYLTPSRLPLDAQDTIASSIATAAAALGLREGPIHAEARLNDLGPWVIEVAARSIGGRCSDALRFELGLSLEEIILRQATGLPLPSSRREPRPAGAMMIPIPAAGTLCQVRGRAEAKAVPGVEEVIVSIPVGEQVVPLPRGDRYLGFIIARGESLDQVEAALREAHRCLAFDIEPRAGQASSA